MPRFFDDYSNTYLTHDSSAGRKQQRRGWKFRENFKLHYEKHLDEWRKSPMGLAAAQQAFLRSRGADDPAVPPLPEGWKEELDEATGITFYVHDESGRRTWVRPNFVPPPPGPPPGPRPGFRPPYGMAGRGPPPPSSYPGAPPPPTQFAGGPPPPTGMPPTGMPPTGVPPPVGVPPTGVPPAGVLPTGVPPAGVLPTGVPPMGVPPTGLPPPPFPSGQPPGAPPRP